RDRVTARRPGRGDAKAVKGAAAARLPSAAAVHRARRLHQTDGADHGRRTARPGGAGAVRALGPGDRDAVPDRAQRRHSRSGSGTRGRAGLMFRPLTLILVLCLYVSILFVIALWGERGSRLARRLTRSPVVYSLALAVYCTSWTYYGSVGSAATAGPLFLTIYLGPTLGVILWPKVLR